MPSTCIRRSLRSSSIGSLRDRLASISVERARRVRLASLRAAYLSRVEAFQDCVLTSPGVRPTRAGVMPDYSEPQAEIPYLPGLEAVAGRFDVILCDVWGVVHDGLQAFAAAGEALTRFRAGGGCVVLVSNAPRPGTAVLRMLDKLHVMRSAFDAIVTSGDLTRAA